MTDGLSVPARWQEQGPQPSSYYQAESFPLVECRASSTSDYCDMFNKVCDVPVLYACKICGKNVSNRWHHASIHRPQSNTCPMCQQSFTRKDNMKAHIRLKHGRPLVLFEALPEHKDPFYYP